MTRVGNIRCFVAVLLVSIIIFQFILSLKDEVKIKERVKIGKLMKSIRFFFFKSLYMLNIFFTSNQKIISGST